VATLIELTLWTSVFMTSGKSEINGFTLPMYLSYALWGTFIARIAANWMYEFRMVDEIESGSINGLMVRPMSFYEYYLSQFMGYKMITTVISLIVPFIVVEIFKLPVMYERLPLVFLLVFYYLFLVHTISFIVSTVAFSLTRIHSLTVAKNLAFWILSGEIMPIDLLPEPYRTWILNLPFCNAVYIPVGYLTGRIPIEMVYHGFMTTTVGLLVAGVLGVLLWRNGVRKYVGTGA
jgi:ABC-2 type transport system permease protein